MGKISYNSEQHQQLQSELKNIGELFKDLITELGNVKTGATTYLKGEAADSLESAIDDLTTKLTSSKSNWETTENNAKKVEELIKKADETSAKSFNN